MALKKRHQGVFNPEHPAPYEISRSRVENFNKCPACFYIKQVRGIDFPDIPSFNLNEATDVLLKRDFDRYRGGEKTHPYLEAQGYGHLVPYQHEHFELWTQSMHYGAPNRMHTVHEPTNLKIGGGLDDVWLNTKTNQLHIVDYKSTSQKADGYEITLEGKWKEAYRRQMDLYVWVMRRMGHDVSDIGYFLYCDGDRFSDYEFLGSEDATMKFKMSLIEYEVHQAWIEPTLHKIKDCLHSAEIPSHSDDCDFGVFIKNLQKS